MTCPKCGSLARIVDGCSSTSIHIPTEYDENGNLIINDLRNTITEYCRCTKCGTSYEVIT